MDTRRLPKIARAAGPMTCVSPACDHRAHGPMRNPLPPVSFGLGQGCAVQDPHFELVRRFGTRVHWIEGLEERAIYCADHDIAFIRAGLDEEARRSTAHWVLSEALAARANVQ